MKKVFIVTGAAGFLGNTIVRKLLEQKQEVRALVLEQDDAKALEGLDCKIYKGDVTKKETLDEIFQIEEDTKLYVIHCAAIVYIKTKYSKQVYDVNVNGTKNIIQKVLEKQNAKLIYVSSVHAIEENGIVIKEVNHFDFNKVEGEYAKTKAEIAQYVLEQVPKGLDACILHPSGIIGPNDYGNSHLTQLMIDFLNGRLTACVKGGYDFVDVRDVADAIIHACDKGRTGECYILSNQYITIKELLDMISKVSGKKKITTILPMWLAKLTAPLSEIYYTFLKQPPLYTKYSLYTLTSHVNFCNDKAKKELGYHNREIEQTIQDTVNWLQQQGRVKIEK